MTNETPRTRLDDNAVFWGFIFGLVFGGITAFFWVPRRGEETRRQIREAVTPTDTVAESLAEGKAAARQHRQQTDSGKA